MHTKWPCWKLILVSIVGILDFTHGAWSMYTKIAACFDLALTSDNDWYLEVAQTESSGLRREMCSSGPKMWRQSIKMTQTLLMVLGGKCVPRVQEWHRQCSRSFGGKCVPQVQEWLRQWSWSSARNITRKLLALRNFQSRNGSWFLRVGLNVRRNLPLWSRWSQKLFWLLF